MPIMCPIDGTVVAMAPGFITLHGGGILCAPILGKISTDGSIIRIENSLLAEPIEMIFEHDKAFVMPTKPYIEAGEELGPIFESDIMLSINNTYIQVVDIGTKLQALTPLSYVQTNKEVMPAVPKRLVVLTTPHFVCGTFDKTEHKCDFFADKFGFGLAKILDGMEVALYTGNINRTEIDLNRSAGRKTSYRQSIRNRIKLRIKELVLVNKPGVIFLIDCHSFPSGSFSSIRVKNPEVCVLMADCLQLIYVEELTDIMRDYGITATKHPGKGNDIIEEFFKLDMDLRKSKGGKIRIMPVLIEINESISDDHLHKVCLGVREWMGIVEAYI